MGKGKASGSKPLSLIEVVISLCLLLLATPYQSLSSPLSLCMPIHTFAIQKVYAFSIFRAELIVYRDGIVHAKIILYANETEASILLPLLASSITNVLVLDENKSPLDYEVNYTSQSLMVYSLGATQISIEYDTDALTSKIAGLWTLQLKAPFVLKVLLPENSTILYLSSTPSSIGTEGGKVAVTLFPGDWEIDYEVPLIKPPPPKEPTIFEILLQYGVPIAAIAALAFFGISFVITILRRRRLQKLRSEEAEILKFIKQKGGRAFEAELRERFPEIPRTSMWRLIRRLEKQGIVSVKKVGMLNVVELK
jgi:uncharacterized membrane protein